MDSLTVAAQQYLSPANRSFWRWSEDASAVEWSDGVTIAFRAELVEVLERWGKKGLPSFDLFVMLLAACRDSWRDDPARIEILKNAIPLRTSPLALEAFQLTIERLSEISSLPPPLRTATVAKAEIVATALGRQPFKTTPAIADRVLQELKNGFPQEPPFGLECPKKSPSQWVAELRMLCDGIQFIDEESLTLQLQTGLGQLIGPADVEPDAVSAPQVGSVQDLLRELERDAEHRGLVHLTRSLMGIVHLPRPVADLEELSLGGVSDLSNRGPLDKLLLSELANDDDVLMTRVALQEALYYLRDKLPAQPPRSRVLLLDAGLRMWGLPRVFATSVALSFAAAEGVTTRVFRAVGDAVVPVNLRSRSGLIEHLSALETAAHPGRSLTAFSKELGVDNEIVIVTGEDVLADSEFRRQLQEANLPTHFVATVSREGGFQLIARSVRGERLIREAMLDLQKLLQPAPKPTSQAVAPLVDPTVNPDMPAILRLKSFPLRLSHAVDLKWTFFLSSAGENLQRILSVTRDGRLMLWDKKGCGAREITGAIPQGKVHVFQEDAGIARLIVGKLGSGVLHLVWLDLASLDYQIVPLAIPPGPCIAVSIHADFILLIRPNSVEFCHGTDGNACGTLKIKGRRWLSGRFFVGPDGIHCLTHNGFSPRLSCLLRHSEIARGRSVIKVFDSTALNSPVIVFSDGSIQVPPEPLLTIKLLSGQIQVTAISPRGDRLVLTNSTGKSIGVSFNSRELLEQNEADQHFVRDEFIPISYQEMHKKFSGIGILDRRLTLWKNRGEKFSLDLSHFADRLQLFTATSQNPTLQEVKLFTKVKNPRKGGQRMMEARLKSGCVAWLDSRGLLHLRSSDSKLPEITLVLHPDNVAGWTSHGHTWGGDYYSVNQSRQITPTEAWHQFLVPLINQLQ